MAKRRRHTPDQIIRKLAEGHKLLAGGTELDVVCRHLQIADSTWHRWVAQYGGMKASDAKRLKELEGENARLLIEDWRVDSTNTDLHSAHGGLTPSEFAQASTTRHQPALA